jgi:hypothetical protein
MKKIELAQATEVLAEYVKTIEEEDTVVKILGHVYALRALCKA